jgi:hypothetical protein
VEGIRIESGLDFKLFKVGNGWGFSCVRSAAESSLMRCRQEARYPGGASAYQSSLAAEAACAEAVAAQVPRCQED